VLSRSFDQDLGFPQCVEDLAVEQFVQQLAVERRDVPVLPGTAGLDGQRVQKTILTLSLIKKNQ